MISFHNRNYCWIVINFSTLLDTGSCLGGIRRMPSHPFLGRDKNCIRAPGSYVSRVYKPSLRRVSRISTETSVLISERLRGLLGNFFLFILSHRA